MVSIDELNIIIKDTLKTSFISYLKTGNVVIDTIISFIVMTMVTAVMSKFIILISKNNFSFYKIYYNLSNIRYIFKRKNVIKITGNRYTDTVFMKTRIDFSMRFQAIINLLNDMTRNNAIERNIRSLSEFQIREQIKYNSKTDMEETEKDFSFIVDQRHIINLDNNIFCRINCQTETEECGPSHNKRTISRNTYDIFIYSYVLSCKELFDYLDKVTDDYETRQKQLKNKHKYILTYQGIDSSDDGGSVIWRIEKFLSNKRFENMFFESKDEIIKQINDFIKGKEIYRKIGKPYHLGIVLYGEPGCGKTSFINALANHLGRSIKEINFSKLKTIDDLERSITCTEYNSIEMDYDKVIITFEDIDCATNIVKSRRINKDMSETSEEELNDNNDVNNMVKALKQLTTNDDKSSKYKNVNYNKCDKSNNITLSNLLNILDGSREMPGRIIIITTNRIDWIDEALLREGRIDIRVEMKKINNNMIFKMLENYRSAIELPLTQEDINIWNTKKSDVIPQPPCKAINKIEKYKYNFNELINSLQE